MSPRFKKPPGPETMYVAVHENGHVIYTSPKEITGLPQSVTVTPYAPQWKKDAAEADYRSLLEAGERQDEAFEDALVAVKLLADALVAGVTKPTPRRRVVEGAEDAIARAKELAPGAWIIKREEIRKGRAWLSRSPSTTSPATTFR